MSSSQLTSHQSQDTQIETLTTAIEQATKSLTKDTAANTELRRRLLQATKQLSRVLEAPDSSIWRVVFAPQSHAALRIAHALKLFTVFDGSRLSLATEKIAGDVNADPVLVLRVLRALSSVDIIDEEDRGMWKLNDSSHKLADPLFGEFAVGLSGLMSPYMQQLPSFLSHTDYRNPADNSHTLFNFATGQSGSMFDWLLTQPDKLAEFGKVMAASRSLRTKGVLSALSALFPSDLKDGQTDEEDIVRLVDVGGGKGDLLERFRMQRPDVKGRMILQDLPHVVHGKELTHGVQYMAHDFFTPQPVKGAQFYFFRHIFHDWPDSACLEILRHTVAAMDRHSHLIIADMVLPDYDATSFGSLIDIGMMTLAGMERTELQWRRMLRDVHLEIISIRTASWEENESASVIEATRIMQTD